MNKIKKKSRKQQNQKNNNNRNQITTKNNHAIYVNSKTKSTKLKKNNSDVVFD